ncbi:MAG: hypothetical protein QNK89_06390 [Lacinutrix sp.]|uniref:PID-CTERM protein-sorting domain-containing protein n=1 Tax=Lacinutrix sp. TaxID=1937692 RepID=UPI0030AE4C92
MIQSKKTIASILFVLISFVCSAQTPTPPESPPGSGDASIDSGLLVLLIAGVLFGIYKLYKFQKKNNLAS